MKNLKTGSLEDNKDAFLKALKKMPKSLYEGLLISKKLFKKIKKFSKNHDRYQVF